MKPAIQARQELSKAFKFARGLRSEERGLPGGELEQRIKMVFEAFAEAMNKMELWTGEGSRAGL